LAKTVRLEFSVLTIVACGVIFVLGMTLVVGDTTQFWRSQLSGSADSTVVGSELAETATVDLVLEQKRLVVVEGISRMMTGALGVSVMSVALGALFLARSWQAGLFNPGGFQKEFHALSLGKNVALGCFFVIALLLVQGGQLAGSLFFVGIFAFFVQGLAVIHALVKQRGMHRIWLYGIYILLVIPHTIFLLAALGLADNIFRLRRA